MLTQDGIAKRAIHSKHLFAMAPELGRLVAAILLLFFVQPFIVECRTLKSHKQSFKFLQNLEGAQKGQNVNGVIELKQFLRNYGYYQTNSNNLTNDFDDSLESALITYQKYHHLNVSGSVTAQTIKSVMIPRCGMRDIIKQTSGNEVKFGHKHSYFHVVSHYRFFYGSPRWPSSNYNLTYKFHSSVKVTGLKKMKHAIAHAFQSWANVSPFTFRRVGFHAQADIVIGFHRGYHGDQAPFDGPGRVAAHANAPTKGIFHLDADEDWSTHPSANQVDLESVAVHEIGHLLGLEHSPLPKSIMFPVFPIGSIRRNLGEDDVNGIRALYAD